MSRDDRRSPRPLRLAALLLAVLLTVAAGWALFAPWWPGSRLADDGGGAGPGRSGLPVYFAVPEFALVAQDGDTLRSNALEGTAWVASFIFTNCRSVCPLVTARMAELRDVLGAEGLLGNHVRLVSITVDPARDTPAVLREYASRYGGSPPEEWAFLTGEPPEGVRRLVQEGFRVSAMLPPGGRLPGGDRAGDTAGGYQVVHAPQVLLVDARRRVRSIHRPRDPQFVDRLMEEIRTLLPSPR